MTWEEVVLKSRDPVWQARFMEMSAIRKGEVAQHFVMEDAGRRVASHLEAPCSIAPITPDVQTGRQLYNELQLPLSAL